MNTDDLRDQYDAFPYPARDPRDEAKRLIVGSPSHLDELNHYVFGGHLARRLAPRRRDDGGEATAPAGPFRVLVAGGGTGDATVMLAQHCANAGIDADILYLDLSEAARAVAEARIQARGLTNVRFRQGSLLDATTLGRFDYIDCCGVLHHLPDPDAGLRALAAALAPGGGIGLMVYGCYGRTGVYPLQDALRRLTAPTPRDGHPAGPHDAGGRVDIARRLVAALPATNWLVRNPFLGDHRRSDADLHDLLLNLRDRAYTVPELYALVDGAGLTVAGWIEPMRYDPATFIADPRLRKRLALLSEPDRAAVAEAVSGAAAKHIAYLVRPEDRAAAPVPNATAIPVLKGADGAAVANAVSAQGWLPVDLAGLSLTLALPRLAVPLLRHIDGRTNLAALHNAVAPDLPWDRFKAQFDAFYATLNGLNMLLLRWPD